MVSFNLGLAIWFVIVGGAGNSGPLGRCAAVAHELQNFFAQDFALFRQLGGRGQDLAGRLTGLGGGGVDATDIA